MIRFVILAVSLVFLFSETHASSLCCCPKKSTKSTLRRLKHARELIGSKYSRSLVSQSSHLPSVKRFIREVSEQRLKEFGRKYATNVSMAIINESAKQGLDPLFILAVIETESQFGPDVIGSHGEIGMMQIKPDTAQWVAEKYGYNWKGKSTLKNPVVNIRIGVAYLAFLREEFEGLAHKYVAAYNMGPAGVRRLASQDIKPRDYSMRVMGSYYGFYQALLDRGR